IEALSDGELLIVDRQPFEALLRDAPAFRRTIRAIAGERRIAEQDLRRLDTVVMVNDTRYDATTIALLVGQYLGEMFGDRVLVATVDREPPEQLGDTLVHRWLPCSTPDGAPIDLAGLPGSDRLDLAIVTFTDQARDRVASYLPQAS